MARPRPSVEHMQRVMNDRIKVVMGTEHFKRGLPITRQMLQQILDVDRDAANRVSTEMCRRDLFEKSEILQDGSYIAQYRRTTRHYLKRKWRTRSDESIGIEPQYRRVMA